MSSDEKLRYENVCMALAFPTSFDMRPVQGAVSLTSEKDSKKGSSSQQVSAGTDNSDAEEQYVDFNSDTDTDGSEEEATEDEGTNGNVQTDMNLHLLYDEEGRSTSVRREGRTATPSRDGLSNRRQKLDTLRSALALFKSMGWITRQVELRSAARVPIIALVHRTGVSCDIAVGLASSDTSSHVRALVTAPYPCSFRRLVAVLKTFLWSHGLDQPFTGGIGSYKLYLMIGLTMDHRMTNKFPAVTPDLGELLLDFFHHFSQEKNFNQDTVIRVRGVTADMSSVTQTETCRRCFGRAYEVLSASRGAAGMGGGGHSSHLALLISGRELKRYREELYSRCLLALTHSGLDSLSFAEQSDPVALRQRKARAAEFLLGKLMSMTLATRAASLPQVDDLAPILGGRLRSFPSPESVLQTLRCQSGRVSVERDRESDDDYDDHNERVLSTVGRKVQFTRNGVIGAAFRDDHSVRRTTGGTPE
eukprot:gene972-1098_t